MRFYLEDGVGENVATKCLRVCSSSSTLQLVGTLAEKFRPDMKTLSARFALHEIHADKGQQLTEATLSLSLSRPLTTLSLTRAPFFFFVEKERKMDEDERPLLVQLNWTTDNREGRFVLKRDQDSSKVRSTPSARDSKPTRSYARVQN